MDELARFIHVWEHEAQKTVALLNALPPDQYDFRPDTGGRSLGELAWHLAEAEALFTYGIEQGKFESGIKPPGVDRPKQVKELAAGFEQVHRDAVARVRKLRPTDLERSLFFLPIGSLTIRDMLWSMVLLHGVHHRGQLVVMCRLAGGQPTALFGPTREEMPGRGPTPEP